MRGVSFERRQNSDVDGPGVFSFEEDGDPAVRQHGDVAIGRAPGIDDFLRRAPGLAAIFTAADDDVFPAITRAITW